jgi:tetratricopeptide (TPR) repeat protein
MAHRTVHSVVGFYAAWTLVVLLILFSIVPETRAWTIDHYQAIAFAVDPTAARAYAYGQSHFDTTGLADYDLPLALSYFEKAAAIDPTYPYLYHELARINFLEGNYDLALAQINFQISLHGDSEPNSYYVRGLIEGYMGQYAAAADDYSYFLQFDPKDWAAMNDDAWVLLKADRFEDAVALTDRGLALEPQNPWLLNSNATALYELGEYRSALTQAQKAETAVSGLTDAQWSHAYPGNDPAIAGQGLESFKQAVADNVHSIEVAIASSTVQ